MHSPEFTDCAGSAVRTGCTVRSCSMHMKVHASLKTVFFLFLHCCCTVANFRCVAECFSLRFFSVICLIMPGRGRSSTPRGRSRSSRGGSLPASASRPEVSSSDSGAEPNTQLQEQQLRIGALESALAKERSSRRRRRSPSSSASSSSSSSSSPC